MSSCVRYAATYDSHLLSGRYCVPSNETLKAVAYIHIVYISTQNKIDLQNTRRIPKDLSKPQADILAFSGPLGVERLCMPQDLSRVCAETFLHSATDSVQRHKGFGSFKDVCRFNLW